MEELRNLGSLLVSLASETEACRGLRKAGPLKVPLVPDATESLTDRENFRSSSLGQSVSPRSKAFFHLLL